MISYVHFTRLTNVKENGQCTKWTKMPLVLRLLLEVLCEILKETLAHLSAQLILLSNRGAMETPTSTAGCRDKLHLRTALPGAEVALGLTS